MHPELERGIALFNAHEYFECHEALEDLWRAQDGTDRRLIQSIIHFAVGLYHHERANPVGAVRQLRKGLDKLGPYLPFYEGLNTAELHSNCAACLEAIEAGTRIPGLPSIHVSQPERR